MKSFETFATVEDRGEINIVGVPFAPGTEVEVTINRKRASADEFAEAWQRLCAELRRSPGMDGISDDDIREEVERYRARQ